MVINFFKIIGILGLILIILGILDKKRKRTKIFYICGGFCLLTYSIHLQDIIFIVLQSAVILAATYSLIKITKKTK